MSGFIPKRPLTYWLSVDQAGQHQFAGYVDDVFRTSRKNARLNGRDLAIADGHVPDAVDTCCGIDHPAAP
jgi:hypothetical protein